MGGLCVCVCGGLIRGLQSARNPMSLVHTRQTTKQHHLQHQDLGWVGFLRALGGVFCGPIYGWILDKYGAATAICERRFLSSLALLALLVCFPCFFSGFDSLSRLL